MEQIQKFLGHSKLETTQMYAESTPEMIKERYQRELGGSEIIITGNPAVVAIIVAIIAAAQGVRLSLNSHCTRIRLVGGLRRR